jgi:pyridoxine kinase
MGSGDGTTRFRIRVPLFDAPFVGTGDLTAALLLAWTHRRPADLAGATERAIASVHAVVRRTYIAFTAAQAMADDGTGTATAVAMGTDTGKDRQAAALARRRRLLELRLTESKADIETPHVVHPSTPLGA